MSQKEKQKIRTPSMALHLEIGTYALVITLVLGIVFSLAMSMPGILWAGFIIVGGGVSGWNFWYFFSERRTMDLAIREIERVANKE